MIQIPHNTTAAGQGGEPCPADNEASVSWSIFPRRWKRWLNSLPACRASAEKTAQRLAFHILSLPEEDAQAFADAIVAAKKTVTYCPVCRNFTAGGLCPICSSPKRDGSVICVVADPRDVAAMERGREFNGKYHVLHGVISPMNHIGPDDIAIKPLLERVAQGGVEGGHHGHQPGYGGGGHRHVHCPASQAL